MNFLERMYHDNSTLTIWIDMDGHNVQATLDYHKDVSLTMAVKAVKKGYVVKDCLDFFDGYHELADYKISQKGIEFFNKRDSRAVEG